MELGVAGAISGVVSGCFFYAFKNGRKRADAMEEALQQKIVGQTGYRVVRGIPRPLNGNYIVAEYSKKDTVFSKTVIKEVWREREIKAAKNSKKDRQESGAVKYDQSYGSWKQYYEEVGGAVISEQDFCVTHRENGAQVAVAVDAAQQYLPLTLKYSRHFDEKEGSTGGGQNVNVNVNTGNEKIMGTKIEREKVGMLREEYILETKDLTIFGNVSRNSDGTIIVTSAGCGGIRPFICSHKTPNVLISEEAEKAKGLKIGAVIFAVIAVGLGAAAAYTISQANKVE